MTDHHSSNWKLVKLSEVAAVVTGTTPSTGDESYWEGSTPFTTPGDLKSEIYQGEAARTLSDAGRRKARVIPAGSTLVTCIGSSVGKIAFSEVECTTNQQINAVIPGRHVDPLFLHYALQYRRGEIERLAGTTAVPLVTKGQLEEFRITLPPLAVQKTIGTVLVRFARVARGIDLLLDAKRALKRGLMSELLSGERRFPAFEHAGAWQYLRLGDIAAPVARRNAGEAVERVLTCSGQHGLIDQTEYFSKIVAGDSREDYFLLHQGEFAYNRSAMAGYPYGAIKRLDRYEAGALSTLNICFRVVEGWDSDFALHFFESGLLNEQLGRITRVGSRAHGLLNVTKADFFSLKVPAPSHEEQKHIASLLNALDREMALLERERAVHESQRRGAMHSLLSGKPAGYEAEEPVEDPAHV